MGRSELRTRVDNEFKNRLRVAARCRGISLTELVDEALKEYMLENDERALFGAHLERIEKRIAATEKRFETIEETLAQFIHLFLFYMPEASPEPAKRTLAKQSADRRFNGFKQLVVEHIDSANTYRKALKEARIAIKIKAAKR